MLPGRVRAAAEDRETTYQRRRFFSVLHHALSQRTRRLFCRQGMECMETSPPATEPEAGEAPRGETSQRRARDDDRDSDTGEP